MMDVAKYERFTFPLGAIYVVEEKQCKLIKFVQYFFQKNNHILCLKKLTAILIHRIW